MLFCNELKNNNNALFLRLSDLYNCQLSFFKLFVWNMEILNTKNTVSVVQSHLTLLRPHGLTIACQSAMSMGFSRQECRNGYPFASPGDLSDPGIEPGSAALQADSLPSEPPGKTKNTETANSTFYAGNLISDLLATSFISTLVRSLFPRATSWAMTWTLLHTSIVTFSYPNLQRLTRFISTHILIFHGDLQNS